MTQQLYETPELNKYGDITQLTQATGGSATDSIVVGVTINTPVGIPVTGTVGANTTPGSGTLMRSVTVP